jgi:glycosyltransferase involved in cell wall biosynthesis
MGAERLGAAAFATPQPLPMLTTLTAVIPTKDRAKDLGTAVASILAQRRVPDELIVVDQSSGTESRTVVEAMLQESPGIALLYVHDPRISGLVAAKQVAADRASGEIICFLEDDVVLEDTFLEAIERGFEQRPDMLGCSGVITNQPNQSAAYARLHRLFFRGTFHDPRPRLFRALNDSSEDLTPCDVLSGGLSAWRRDVFASVSFDIFNGFHMLEDIEFSTRVVRELGHHLYVNRRARLAHYFSPAGRDAQGARQRRKVIEAMMFSKKRREWHGVKRGLALVMFWWFGEALAQSVRIRSAGPVRGYFRGLRDGIAKRIQSGAPSVSHAP